MKESFDLRQAPVERNYALTDALIRVRSLSIIHMR